MKYFFKKTMTVKRILVIVFSVSLFFELTQLSGLYGIYYCPYRLFNVDDLILNTVGAVIGFLIAPIFLAIFPSKEQVLEKSERVFKEILVRPAPQLLAIIIDYIIVLIAWFFLTKLVKVDDPIVRMLFILTGLFVLQFFMPLLWNGRTLGTKILRFQLVKVNNENSWAIVLLKRWFALIAPWFTLQIFNIVRRFATLELNSVHYRFYAYFQVAILLLMFVIVFALIIHVLVVIVRKNRHSYYFDELAGIEARYEREIENK